MEFAPGTRDPVWSHGSRPTVDQARIEAVADKLAWGYAAIEMIPYPSLERSGTDMEIPLEALEAEARIRREYGTGNVVGLRPSEGLAAAYGYEPSQASDLMFYMAKPTEAA